MAIHSNLLGNGVAGNITISDATNGDAVTTMYFCNTHTVPVTFNLHVCPNANVASKIVATVSTIGL